jgi:hypothetical protein
LNAIKKGESRTAQRECRIKEWCGSSSDEKISWATGNEGERQKVSAGGRTEEGRDLSRHLALALP